MIASSFIDAYILHRAYIYKRLNIPFKCCKLLKYHLRWILQIMKRWALSTRMQLNLHNVYQCRFSCFSTSTVIVHNSLSHAEESQLSLRHRWKCVKISFGQAALVVAVVKKSNTRQKSKIKASQNDCHIFASVASFLSIFSWGIMKKAV